MCSLSFSLQALPSHFKLTPPFTRPSYDKTMVSIMIKILHCGTCHRSFETSPIELKLYSAIIYSGAPRAREARAERSTMGNKIW